MHWQKIYLKRPGKVWAICVKESYSFQATVIVLHVAKGHEIFEISQISRFLFKTVWILRCLRFSNMIQSYLSLKRFLKFSEDILRNIEIIFSCFKRLKDILRFWD